MFDIKKKVLTLELDWTKKEKKTSFFPFSKSDDGSIDLDLSVTFLNSEGRFVDRTVSYLNDNARGVTYSKDDKYGDTLSDGQPNEAIVMETSLMNPDVRYVAVFINNLDGKLNSFNELSNATLTVLDRGKEIHRICLSNDIAFKDSNCTIVGYFDKEEGWALRKLLIPEKNKNLRNFELQVRQEITNRQGKEQ